MHSETMRWCLTEQQFNNTPSIKEGLTIEKELSYRRQMGMLIQKMGQKLKLSQVCINSAVVFSHRFFVLHSFTRFDRFSVGSSALFLSSKLGDQPKRSELVVKIAHHCLKPEDPPLDQKATKMKCQELVFHENILLSTLGFDFDVEQVCAHVAQFCGLLKLPKDLAKTAYVLAIYSLQLTTMCIRYPPKLEACVCIALAGELSHKDLKESSNVLPEGWCMKALGPSWNTFSEKNFLPIKDLKTNFLAIIKQYPSILNKLAPLNVAIKRPFPQNSTKIADTKKPKTSSRHVKTKIHSLSKPVTRFCEADTSINIGSSLLKTKVPEYISTSDTKPLIQNTDAYIKSMGDQCKTNTKLISLNDTSETSSVISCNANLSTYQRI